MKHTVYIVTLLCLLALPRVQAQETSIDAEFRLNPVYSRGFRIPLYANEKPGMFTMQRTRLIFNYNKTDDLKAEVVLQDRRFWGDQEDRADVANMAVFRAWVEKSFTPSLSLRLGRQGFEYDEQHILGDPNWVGTRAHDAALLRYEKDSWKIHTAVAYNANGQELKREVYDYTFMYKNLQFLWAEKTFGKNKITFIGMNRGMENGDTTTSYMQTFGPYASLVINNQFSLKGLYYHQLGKNTLHQNVNAYFYSVQILFSPSERLKIVAGVDAGSGSNQADYESSETKTSSSFDRHYGLLHGHFGYMDYFYVVDRTLVGAHDYYIKTTVKLTNNLSLENHLHDFATSAYLYSPGNETQNLRKQLGVENDFMVNYKVSSSVKAQLAYCRMFGTPTLDALFGGQKSVGNEVIYAVITANLNFYKNKKESN